MSALSPPKPPWLRVRPPSGETTARLKALIRRKSLHTVCEEARCPNMAECWGCGTATFLILGDGCTRDCRFCAVRSGPSTPGLTDSREPEEVALAVEAMGLDHAVITSVTRDDLPDGGAAHFAQTIRCIREKVPSCTVEVLIPDFAGNPDALDAVLSARPDILGHNVETVPRLYPRVRPQALYARSIGLLGRALDRAPGMTTKSGIMVGLGETWEEILQVMKDLVEVGCAVFTVGQYLRPSREHLPVERYVTPEEFMRLREEGLRLGFQWVESGPLVRSSYHAGRQAAFRRSSQ